MTKTLQITIRGEGLDEDNEGDWTISLHTNGQLAAQTGLSGAPLHAIAAAHEVAIENDLVEDPDHG
jgi:hypothetical protein